MAQSHSWYGLVIEAAVPDYYNIVELSDASTISRVVAAVSVPAVEYVHVDAMRCLTGFCAFTATNFASGVSYAYTVNTATGNLQSKVLLQGTCAHMHVDYSSHHLYTLCTEAGGATQVWEVAGPTPSLVADISAQVGSGTILPGQTTHCSAFQSMYVGVDLGGAGKDLLVTVGLQLGNASSITLQQPLWRTLWARCDGSDEVGGIAWSANGTASFGTLNSDTGAFIAWASITVPAGVEPSGLLTETEVEQSVAAFYPLNTLTNATGVTGFLWAVDPFAKAGDDFLSPINYQVRGECSAGPSHHPLAQLRSPTSRPTLPPLQLIAASFDRDPTV